MIETIFLYKQKILKMSLAKLQQEYERKKKHSKITGQTQTKIWILKKVIEETYDDLKY